MYYFYCLFLICKGNQLELNKIEFKVQRFKVHWFFSSESRIIVAVNFYVRYLDKRSMLKKRIMIFEVIG